MSFGQIKNHPFNLGFRMCKVYQKPNLKKTVFKYLICFKYISLYLNNPQFLILDKMKNTGMICQHEDGACQT